MVERVFFCSESLLPLATPGCGQLTMKAFSSSAAWHSLRRTSKAKRHLAIYGSTMAVISLSRFFKGPALPLKLAIMAEYI